MYTFKVRIHPNNKQATKLRKTMNKCIECQNLVHEYIESFIKNNEQIPSCLEIRKWFTKTKKIKDNEIKIRRENMTKKQCGKNHLDTLFYDVSNDSLKQMVKDTYNSFVRFFKKLSKYPNKKSYKDSKKSMYVDPYKIEFTNNKVKLEKIANNQKSNRQVLNWIKLAEKNRIPQNVKYYNPRISYDESHFYLTVSVDDEYAPKKKIIVTDDRVLGIDLNNKEIVTSENKRYIQATKTKKYNKIKRRKKKLQRALSRKYIICNSNNTKNYKLSNNFKKNKFKLKKLEQRMVNIRDDCHNKIITDILINPPRKIVMEDLYVNKMSNKKKRKKMSYEQKNASKNIVEASFRKFRLLLENRARKHNIEVLIANRYYPSTKLCSNCKSIKEIEIKERVYKCEKCGLIIDRDLNSAINLKKCFN